MARQVWLMRGCVTKILKEMGRQRRQREVVEKLRKVMSFDGKFQKYRKFDAVEAQNRLNLG